MKTTPSQLYRDFPEDGLQRIEETIVNGLDRIDPVQPVPVIFRADDIGVISTNFLRMLDLFQRYQTPLCLAVVPTWVTRSRWMAIQAPIDTLSPLWCWHQHGWSHTNHETAGKKCEFGLSRSEDDIERDLDKGKERLETVLGPDFSPFFTPPWNRCSDTTIEKLKKLGFSAISRSRGEQNEPKLLPDMYINVDLHTRKESISSDSLDGLCRELKQAIREKYIGIMIHHQRMNDNAFILLDRLLGVITAHQQIKPYNFKQPPNSPDY